MISDELMNDVVDWHYSKFPDCTFEDEIKKLEEELAEFSVDHNEEELADVLIVSVVLMCRYKSNIGIEIFNSFWDFENEDYLEKIIKAKLERNKKRIWHKVKGVYKHVNFQ